MSDILNRKILDVGDKCYFIRSSSDSPTVYIRFKGIVGKIDARKDRVYYYIEVQEVVETLQVIKDYVHQKSYRVSSESNKYRFLKTIHVLDLLSAKDFNVAFNNRFKNILFEVPMILTFESSIEMNRQIAKVNTHLLDRLATEREELITLTNRIPQ